MAKISTNFYHEGNNCIEHIQYLVFDDFGLTNLNGDAQDSH